jgi:hypothetical protein
MRKGTPLLVLALLAASFIASPAPAKAALAACASGGQHYGNQANPIMWKGWAKTAFEGTAHLCVHVPQFGSVYIPNLKNVAYNYNPDTCEGQFPTSAGTWNDCFGSDKWSLSCAHTVYLYTEFNYGNLVAARSGSGTDFIIPGTDAISSMKITYREELCN